MKNYLEGYLDVLPQGESSKVEDVLKATKSSIDAGIVTEAEFKELVRKIAEEHEQLTEYIPQVEKVDDVLHNAFFSKVSTDVNLMFAESQLIERALGSYERLYDGILADLSKEIKALRERIYSLRLVAEGENGLIVKTVDFSDNSSTETDRVKYAHLFKDRDGSDIPDAVVQRVGNASYVTLGQISGKDRLRDDNGGPVAQLEIVDYRGEPISQTTYPISNAIDDSPDSYWGEVVLADEELNIGLDDIAPGGALMKFTVTLPRQEIISEIALSPFTHRPLEIASIKYEEDIETYHVPKEILSEKREGTDTIVIQFPAIVAKRLTFYLRQRNFVKNTYLIKETDLTKSDLWDKISKRETDVTLSTPPGVETLVEATVSQAELDTYSGWDIYLQELAKYEDAHAKYVIALADYQVKKAKWDQDIATYKSAYASYVSTINSLNSTYGRYGVNYAVDPSAI